MIRNEKGQGMVEYIVMVALIAIGAIAIVGKLGEGVRIHFANTTNRFVSNDLDAIPQVRVTEPEYRDRDMDDYYKAGRSRSDDGE